MTREEIIQTIKEQRDLYLHHCNVAKDKLVKHIHEYTSEQIIEENMFIQDMESRAYAMKLLLEEIEGE